MPTSAELPVAVRGYPVPALVFGGIERRVRLSQESVQVGRPGMLPPRHPDAARYGKRYLARHERRRGHSGAQALGLGQARLPVGAGQDRQKLLAAVAPDGVIMAARLLHAPRRLAQHGVPGQVAMRVVDHLEMVQIHHDQGQRAPLPHGPFGLDPEDFEDAAPVEQAGESIVGSLVAKRLAGGQQFRLKIEDPAAGPQPAFTGT